MLPIEACQSLRYLALVPRNLLQRDCLVADDVGLNEITFVVACADLLGEACIPA